MDMEMFERDLERAFRRMPPKLLEQAAGTLMEHREQVEKVFPLVVTDLMRHFGTIMMEGASGLLDKDELYAVVQRVVAKLGVKLPGDNGKAA